MAQRARAFATKPDDVSSVLRTHRVERENRILHAHDGVYQHTHTLNVTDNQSIIFLFLIL